MAREITFQESLGPATTINLEDSYVFQRLEDCKASYQDTAWQSSTSPLFLARTGSVKTAALRRTSSHIYLERNPSINSPLSSANVARRASIAVGNAVEKVKDTVSLSPGLSVASAFKKCTKRPRFARPS